MAEESTFRSVLTFFDKLGIYDVILPFLLVFTIVFAILEKSKIFGTEKVGEREYAKKNLNAMVAFVTAFFVVASTKLVAIINRSIANTVLLLILSVFFLMLVGSFYSSKEETFLQGGWRTGGMIFMLIGIILIFLDALGWLAPAWNYIINSWSSTVFGSILLVIVIIVFMAVVTYEKKEGTDKK